MAFGTFNDELANAGGPAQNIGGHTLDITRVWQPRLLYTKRKYKKPAFLQH